MASTRKKTTVYPRMASESDNDRSRVSGPSINFNSQDFPGIPLPMSYLNSGIQNSSNNIHSAPPPLPPRADASRYSRFSNYNSYSPYSRFQTNMYSPAYGGYRTPFNRYGGMPHDSYNSFIQLAEESTRPAFESIESVVDIVSSISMMVESTYHAVYSSYNAILGVIDQFARLKDHMSEVLSFLALLRGLRYICLKILYLLRLRKDNPSIEAAWNKAQSLPEHSEISRLTEDGKSPWPFFLFLGLVVGAPWLMFKLLAKSVKKKPFDVASWKGRYGFGVSVGNYNFNPSRQGELSFKAGEMLYIAPKDMQAKVPRGWLLACNNNNQVGLIPQNYLVNPQRLVKLAGKTADGKKKTQDIVPDVLPADQVNPFAPDSLEDNPSTSGALPNPSSTEEPITEQEE